MTLASALLAVVAAPPADARTARQALERAERALRIDRERGPTALFGLPRPLAAGHSVGPALPETPVRGKRATARQQVLHRRTWFFWEDLAYGARFQHPSRIVLVDDRTGKVTTRRTKWWPLIDGRDAPWIGRKYGRATYRRYLDADGRRVLKAATAASARRLRAAASPRTSALPAGALAGDCIVTIGLRYDSQFAGDFKLLDTVAGVLGVKVYPVPPNKNGGDPGGEELRAFVQQLANDPARDCRDIVIYIDGHGAYKDTSSGLFGYFTDKVGLGATNVGIANRKEVAAPKAEGKPAVKPEGAYVFDGDLAQIARVNPNTEFKFIVDACFAASMAAKVANPKDLDFKNVALIVVSSTKTEVSYSPLVGSSSPFSGGLFGAIREVAESPEQAQAVAKQPGSTMVNLIKAGYGEAGNWTSTLGLTHPSLVTPHAPLLPAGTAPPPPPPPPPNQPPVIRSFNAVFGAPATCSTCTLYEVDATDPEQKPLTYTWVKQPPPDGDPAATYCGTFTENSPEPFQAVWDHPNSGPSPCSHAAAEHPGWITVVVSDPLGAQTTFTYTNGSAPTEPIKP